MHFQEYEELANKIHEYQLREQRLQEQMSMGGSPPPSPPPRPEMSEDPPMQSPGPPLTPQTNTSALRNQLHSQRSPQPVRATNAHVKAYLPNSQVTSVRHLLLFFLEEHIKDRYILNVSAK